MGEGSTGVRRMFSVGLVAIGAMLGGPLRATRVRTAEPRMSICPPLPEPEQTSTSQTATFALG